MNGMGVLCSTIDKEGDDPSEGKKAHGQTASFTPRRLRKMPQFAGPTTRSQQKPDWREAIPKRTFASEDEYDKARAQLRLAEKETAFDHEINATASKVEKRAAELVRRIRESDRKKIYGENQNSKQREGRRAEGQHFLGSVEHINNTELMRIARRMPKGAHLHIHFNSCLPARFLIREARNIHAMYIRSTTPLVKRHNFADSRISFMVMTEDEASRWKPKDGVEIEVRLADIDIFTDKYESNQWMSYQTFQQRFCLKDEYGRVILQGTEGAETWLESKMLISEEEAHGTHQTGRGIWERFNYRTQMMKGLFAYESAFRNYTRECILDFVKDNIQYAEIRPNFMSTNSVKSNDGTESFGNEAIMRIIKEELEKTMLIIGKNGDYFGGMKVIYCTPRSFSKDQIIVSLDECIALKHKYRELLCGFDLVGNEEMGHELREFVPEFLEFQKKCEEQDLEIPFLFHCGETLQVGSKIDDNLYDAVLLDAKRIGHGYAIAAHPVLMDLFKAKGIAIESCPISNEVLGLTPTMAGHHLPILLANDVPCTINSDNATFYKSSLSHDFYQTMIGSEYMSLLGWKQLAKWSLEHSCMNEEERKSVTKEWNKRWNKFCQWIVDEYGSRYQDLDHMPNRH